MVTANVPIVLRTASGSLALVLDEKGVGGWCQVRLLDAAISRQLGAERLEYIAGKLNAFLADPAPRQRWVLSLSELHTSVYGEHVAGASILHLQDADANWFAKLELTPTERNEWMHQLSRSCET